MFTFTAVSIVRRFVGAGVCWCLITSGLHGQERSTALRVLDPTLGATLTDLYPESLTIRELIDEIERSDLIVHVIALPLVNRQRLDGELQFVVSAGGRRFLRIAVNPGIGAQRRAATLGHELQHAIEVARDPAVVDQGSMARLYRRIGHASPAAGTSESFETDEAQKAGRQVLADVKAARDSSGTGPAGLSVDISPATQWRVPRRTK